MEKKTLKQLLVERRTRVQLSVKDAARECGLSQQVYWALENTVDDPHLPTVLRVCRFYGIKLEEISHPKVDTP